MRVPQTRAAGALPGPRRAGAALLLALLALPGAFAATTAAPSTSAGAAAVTTPAAASPPAYSVVARADWGSAIIRFDISLDLRAAGLRPPAGRLEAERMIDRDLAGLLKDAVFSLAVDSHRLVADSVADGSVDINELLPLALQARLQEAVYSSDFQSFRTAWEFPFLPVLDLYVRHSTAAPQRPLLGYVPTRAFTGLVIYATGPLPVHGEAVEDRLAPCLFPRIWDEDMNLLFDRNIVEPAALRAWGPVAYGTDGGDAPAARVGSDPLRITAMEIFGDRRTDVVISRDDARRILGHAANRALLAAGRVQLVLDEAVTTMRY